MNKTVGGILVLGSLEWRKVLKTLGFIYDVSLELGIKRLRLRQG